MALALEPDHTETRSAGRPRRRNRGLRGRDADDLPTLPPGASRAGPLARQPERGRRRLLPVARRRLLRPAAAARDRRHRLGGTERARAPTQPRRRRLRARRLARLLIRGLGETSLCRRATLLAPRTASSVAPVSLRIRTLPASLPRNDHRTPTTSDAPPNPPRTGGPLRASAAAPCGRGRRRSRRGCRWSRRRGGRGARSGSDSGSSPFPRPVQPEGARRAPRGGRTWSPRRTAPGRARAGRPG